MAGFISAVWSQFLDPAAYQSRQETLRYDSPAMHGFIFSASVSEASGSFNQTNWGMMLRYAGEYNGFRIAAGVGFDHTGDTWTNPTQTGGGVNNICVEVTQLNCVQSRPPRRSARLRRTSTLGVWQLL